jgi:CRISPR-associated endonuclease Csn1
MNLLGFDIGTNSVSSGWVDTKAKTIEFGVSVFPAGVEELQDKRGAPKNQARRSKRSSRRTIRRRAERKRCLRELLMEVGLLPSDPKELQKVFVWDSWNLRREGLQRSLNPYEFGRILVHLNQHRGALGINAKKGDEGKVKTAIDNTRLELLKRYGPPEGKKQLLAMHDSKEKDKQEQFASKFNKWIEQNDVSFGRMMADLKDEYRVKILDKNGEQKKNKNGEYKYYHSQPIRNRQDSFAFHADRLLIRNEFQKLWIKQKSFESELSKLLNNELLKNLDNPEQDKARQHKGEIFGQFRTYWKTGTLGRCDLEPTDRCVPIADMYAQEFRVLDYVNNLRIREGRLPRPLTKEQRDKLIELLRKPQQGKGAGKIKNSFGLEDLKKKIEIDKKALGKQGIPEDYISFTVSEGEKEDQENEVVCDWFYRDITCGVFEEEKWLQIDEKNKDSINQAILKFDPDDEEHERRLRQTAEKWWGLSKEAVDKLVTGWKSRPKLDNRLNLSRKAINNLLPIMRNLDPEHNSEYPNQIRARKILSHNLNNALSVEQRVRYAPKLTKEFKELLISKYGQTVAITAIRQRGLNKNARHYLKKHVDKLLPPAPEISNPVVRKAIHEVRNHILAHLEAHQENGKIVLPDQVVIELAREGRQSARVRDAIYAKNKARRKIRERIIKDHGLDKLRRNQQERAIERVLLCCQQNFVCPYTNLSAEDRRKQGKPENGECVYTGKMITEDQAAHGVDVEIDHIVPYSRCGDDSINNKVLCYREANKNKGNQTPKEWKGENSDEFIAIEQRMRHLDIKGKEGAGPPKEDYFSKKDYIRKWENLHRAPEPDEFRNSQLSDTAYASKQVGDYLRSALFDGESDGKQHVFFTNGKLTARLRNDWMLYREKRETVGSDDPQAKEKDNQNYEKLVKDRSDHRHHAIDAVVIALTPDYINPIAEEEKYREDYYRRTGWKPARTPMKTPNPWTSKEDLRRDVLSKLYQTFDDWGKEAPSGKGSGTELIVSHRPEKRRLIGSLHNDMPHGKTKEPDTYVRRKQINDLIPQKKTDSATWVKNIRDDRIRDIVKESLSREGIDVIEIRPQRGRPSIKFIDLKTKEMADRDKIRKALSGVRMPSGVPINSIRILISIGDAISIPCKDGVTRFYESDNNHHMEILKDKKTGEWSGYTVRMGGMGGAAERNIERLRALKKAGVPPAHKMRKIKREDPVRYREVRERYRPIIKEINQKYAIVNRNDRDGKEFVMSLAIGETFHLRPKRNEAPGYFVVFQVDRNKICFTPHWDARRAKGGGVENPREEISITPSDLKDFIITTKNGIPEKVRIGPLGDVKVLVRD